LQHRKTVTFKNVDKTYTWEKRKNGYAGKAGQDRMGKKGKQSGQGGQDRTG
jgi:hypothetical protein